MTTLGNDPGFINGTPEYDAEDLRLLDSVDLLSDGSALGSRVGVRPSSVEGLEPSVAGSTYTVSPGLAVISKDVDGALGAYRIALSQAVVEPVPAADAVNARKDVIYLRVFDTDVDGLGMREGQVVYEAGTPSVTPVAPTVPADALFLADVDVPAAGGGNPTLVDRRVYTVASGGVLPTGVYPPAPYVGQTVYRTDTDTLEVFTATGWKVYQEYVSTEAPIERDVNIGDYGYGQHAYRRGDQVTVTFEATATINWSSAWSLGTIPAGYRPPVIVWVVGINASTGAKMTVRIGADGAMNTYDSLLAGQTIHFSSSYPAA
jgi:hypothetical protein